MTTFLITYLWLIGGLTIYNGYRTATRKGADKTDQILGLIVMGLGAGLVGILAYAF